MYVTFLRDYLPRFLGRRRPLPPSPLFFPTLLGRYLAPGVDLLAFIQRQHEPSVPKTLVKWPGRVTGIVEKRSDRSRTTGCPFKGKGG